MTGTSPMPCRNGATAASRTPAARLLSRSNRAMTALSSYGTRAA
ncbi:hypothetical protein [Streptomyces sp. NRRL WC-3742]|nr:hypothetical protein [Streptomyces sp. NRRL WC-3742]